MEQENYIVYIRTDEQGRILEANSSAFLADTTGWTAIDEGLGDKYHHAQGNYFPAQIYTEDGIPRYKLETGEAVERTEEEIEADRAALPEPEPTETEKLRRRVAELENQILTMRLGG